ncbi:AT-hook motif nuclear-localized protein 5-like isoform X2 [Tripterygium wilfordii]|uniref:AT-hook motif nuclear-localized protein 5-like isoform X2 n=1 Tax=Tripterygium wilfordii TaxID=458696 RepID=UPI0018F81393|nr:AT-hook motif nuclear-localized protein 5-like isoform X2 [Tripterygium wilfordii]
MDGREGMALSGGSSSYYIHRGGIRGSGSGSQAGELHLASGFRSFSNPNLQPQSNAQPGTAFSIEPSPQANFGHNINVGLPQADPPVKKKRGRPRKYAPDGQVSLGLLPLPVRPKPSSGSDPMTPKRCRGRPPGTGRKQQLSLLGEWMNSSAGLAFAPHVATIAVGEGRFQILCLSGSYLVAEDGGPRSRTGGMSASLSSPDGHVIGGAVATLIAATPVQVVLCSFVYGGSKSKDKHVDAPKDEGESAHRPDDNSVTPKSSVPTSIPSQNYNPSPVNTWPNLRPVDHRNPHADIDLTRG